MEGRGVRAQGQRAAELLRAAARTGAVLATALSPWLFGSADPWAYLTVCLIAGLSSAAWLVSLMLEPQSRIRAPGVTLALLMLAALVVVQMLPLPAGLVAAVSPLAAEARSAQRAQFAETGASDFLPPGQKADAAATTISASPGSTVRSFWLLMAYVGVFLVLANCLSEWDQVRRAATVLAVSGFAMAFFAMVQGLSGTHRIYWFHTPRFGGTIFGPFTNRNHYAAQMNMLFAVAVGLLLAGGATRQARHLASRGGSGGSRLVLLGFGAVLMAASVGLSLSRGGISSLALALGIVGGVAAFHGGVRGRGKVLAAVAVLALGAVVWLGWRPVVERFGTLAEVARDPLNDTRSVALFDTLRLFATAPLLGSGFGSFQHTFSIFQSPSIQDLRWLHAHNEYAQLLAEGGLLGAFLFTVAAAAFVIHVWRRVRSAEKRGRLMVCGLAVGLVAVALHSLVDYGLHRPANAFLLAALCGLMVACVHLRGGSRRPRPQGGEARARRVLAVRVAALASLALVLSLATVELRDLRGELAFARLYRLSLLTDRLRDGAQLEAAVRNGSADSDLVLALADRNPDALWTVSATSLQWAGRPELNPILRLNLADRAVGAAVLAVRSAPSNYENWVQLARAFRGVGLAEQAASCLERARRLAPRAMVVDL